MFDIEKAKNIILAITNLLIGSEEKASVANRNISIKRVIKNTALDVAVLIIFLL